MTFFEITTAAAFLAFAEQPADAVLLEVGLGGRLDATNVVARPRLTVITQVSIDHADKLGDTLAKIAAEKAGILKRGIRGVISQQPEEAMEAIRAVAGAVGAPLSVWGEDYDAFEQSGRLLFHREDGLLDLPSPALLGRHQIVNAGTAVAAAVTSTDLGLSEAAIAAGLTRAEWPARMQRLDGGLLAAALNPGTELWLDGGHNPAGGAAIAQSLADLEERSSKPLHLIVGMMGQKDAAGFLAPFRGLARDIVVVPITVAHEAPQPPDALGRIALALGFRAELAADVPDAHPPPRKRGAARQAHPDLRLPLSRRPSAGAPAGHAGPVELEPDRLRRERNANIENVHQTPNQEQRARAAGEIGSIKSKCTVDFSACVQRSACGEPHALPSTARA